MCMAGDECHLMATHDLEKVVCICDLGIVFKPFAERTMLRDIKIRAERNLSLKALHPLDYMVSITFNIILLSIVDDVIDYYYDVISKEECIVFRAELLSVKSCRLEITGHFKLMVMIAYYRIERNACAYDFSLVVIDTVKFIPADIAESETYRNAVKTLCSLANILKRLARKLREMLRSPCLRIGYSHD